MQIDTLVHENGAWGYVTKNIAAANAAQLVFVFGGSDALQTLDILTSLRARYPGVPIVGASSSGNILGSETICRSAVATAVRFERGAVKVSCVDFAAGDNLQQLTDDLLGSLKEPGLKHVFVLSGGGTIDGSALVGCINKMALPVPVTGGMAGDGKALVVMNESLTARRLLAVGFYGDELAISTGCQSGWSAFGADRVVTRSNGSQVYELDGEPALDLYKRYLGEYSDELPASGRRFPLSIRSHLLDDTEVIRSVINVDERLKSVIFAGDVPEGYIGRLMKPDSNVLVEGAMKAALSIAKKNQKQALALVVSCFGRQTVMESMVEEELEALESVLGVNVQLTGFYSYGELAPLPGVGCECQLHNQTMTLTVIYED